MNASSDYTSLGLLLGCYFHQDFCDEYASPDEAINGFVSNEPKETIIAAYQEIDKLIKSRTDEATLGRTMFQLGCWYDPSSDGISCREWLLQVEGVLRSS